MRSDPRSTTSMIVPEGPPVAGSGHRCPVRMHRPAVLGRGAAEAAPVEPVDEQVEAPGAPEKAGLLEDGHDQCVGHGSMRLLPRRDHQVLDAMTTSPCRFLMPP